MEALARARLSVGPAMRLLRLVGCGARSSRTALLRSAASSSGLAPSAARSARRQRRSPILESFQAQLRRCLAQESAEGGDRAAFLGIFGDKDEQIARKNSDVDEAGIWSLLPDLVRESLKDPSRSEFISWVGHGVTKGKAAIIRLVTDQEAAAIIACMGTESDRLGVMAAERVAELYVGRVNTARHLIADKQLAECFFQRVRHCRVEEDGAGLLESMHFGEEVVAVNEKIRLVTTAEGGGHQKHADISERSDDGARVSRLTFQCYLNPERYTGGHFQLYPQDGEAPVDIPMTTGSAVVFVQEDPELMHGGGRILGGEAKRAIRGNLDVLAAAEVQR